MAVGLLVAFIPVRSASPLEIYLMVGWQLFVLLLAIICFMPLWRVVNPGKFDVLIDTPEFVIYLLLYLLVVAVIGAGGVGIIHMIQP